MSSTSNVWSTRLEKRLSALADGASKESLQTLARWVAFNRKHAKEFVPSIRSAMLASPGMARSWLYWQFLDQILLQDKGDSSRFDRAEGLRMELGEHVIVPLMKEISGDLMLKVKPFLEVWDSVNVFGGPTLINQIKRAASSPSKSEKAPPPAPAKPEEPTDEFPVADDNDVEMEDAPPPAPPLADPPPFETSVPLREERRHSIINFDFEKEGVPAGKVEAREFLEPCKAVATLQITRDLRSDSTVHLRSYLTSIPKEIREDMEAYKKQLDETGEMPELDEKKVGQYSTALSSDLLDLNIEEALDNVRSFREIVKKLKTARAKLFHLLIKSRCDFGSHQAAEAFLGLDSLTEKLESRRGPLLDAMDLEGLEPPKEEAEEVTKEFESFTWYNPEEPTAKRQKVEST